MKSIFKTFVCSLLLVGLLFLLPVTARAVPQGMWGDQPFSPTHTTGSTFISVDISGGVSTDPILVYGYRMLTFELDFVHSSATSVTMTCYESGASGGTYRYIPILTATGSLLTSDVATYSNDVTGNENWTWSVSLLGWSYVKCTFTAVAGGANDKLTLGGILAE